MNQKLGTRKYEHVPIESPVSTFRFPNYVKDFVDPPTKCYFICFFGCSPKVQGLDPSQYVM